MNNYLKNGKELGWGPETVVINPEKVELLKNFAKGSCLDVGFGSGIYTKQLNLLGHSVIGADNEKVFVNSASKKYPNIKFIRAQATKLPFQNLKFDTTIAFDILEHIADKKALKEFFRVSKRVIFSVPMKNTKILTKYGLSHAHYMDNTHLRVYTIKKLKMLIKKLGYKIIYLNPAMPISLSGILIEQLSKKSWLNKILLKMILKPFLPEPAIYSTIFGVLEKGSKS